MSEHNELGRLGEEMAVEYLISKGYTILERNWRFGKAEIDIIAQKDPEILVIAEVKTRQNRWAGNPEDFVNTKKIKHLVAAADEYIVSHDLDVEVRFDIIAIVLNSKQRELSHLEDAFYFF